MAEMRKVTDGGYSTTDAIYYSLMLLPRQVYELFPLVALTGTILGIGSLASSNELTVLRAAGVSINRIAQSVMRTGFLVVLVVVLVGETVAPELEKAAQQYRLVAMKKNLSFSAGGGLWAREGDEYINIKLLRHDGLASGLTRYSFEGGRLVQIDTAKEGRFENRTWAVNGVMKTFFTPNGVVKSTLKKEHWSSALSPDVASVATLQPENLAVKELVTYIDYLERNALDTKHHETAMWMRIFSPLATSGMILLALPVVFGPLRSVTIGQRVMIGSLIGIGFYLLNGMVSRFGLVFDISPLLSAGVPTLLVYCVWFLLMRRVH
jgi:lipopolysaccharide export system permease protein